MTSSAIESELMHARATSVFVTDEEITVELDDGRTLSVPTLWYPRLVHATTAERKNFEIDDVGIMWPEVEADFSIRGLLLGRMSGESPECFKAWLDARKNGKRLTVMEWLASKRKARDAASKTTVVVSKKRAKVAK